MKIFKLMAVMFGVLFIFSVESKGGSGDLQCYVFKSVIKEVLHDDARRQLRERFFRQEHELIVINESALKGKCTGRVGGVEIVDWPSKKVVLQAGYVVVQKFYNGGGAVYLQMEAVGGVVGDFFLTKQAGGGWRIARREIGVD